jgi:ribosomal-protein-alanine N-acetyltransferase
MYKSLSNMQQSEILFETKRLYITKPSKDDYDKLCIMQTDPEVMKFLGGVLDKDTIYKKMEFFLSQYKKHNIGYGLVYDKQNDKFIGRAGLNKFGFDDNEDRITFGIALMKDFSDLGYGLEICEGLIDYAANIIHLNELYAIINKDNSDSLKLAHKLKAQLLGEIIYFNEPRLLFKKSIKEYRTLT